MCDFGRVTGESDPGCRGVLKTGPQAGARRGQEYKYISPVHRVTQRCTQEVRQNLCHAEVSIASTG